MKYPLHRHFIAGVFAMIAGVVLIPLLLLIIVAKYISSFPSRVGQLIPVERGIHATINWVFNADLMRSFRDDIFYRIRPHLEFDDECDRWWVIREMEMSKQKTNKSLQSGEYVLVILLGLGSIFLNASIYGLPASAILTLLAVSLSGLILVRITTMEILIFDPKLYLEESTHDLAVRMAFNKGPLSRGSSIPIALLALFIGLTNGRGYELGLEIVEQVAAASHPKNGRKWYKED